MTAVPARLDTVLRLAGDVRVWTDGTHLALVGEAGMLEVEGSGAALRPALDALQGGISLAGLLAVCEAALALDLLRQLFDLHWLHIVTHDGTPPAPRYGQVEAWLASVTLQPRAALERLGACQVAILGVGGLGIQVLEHLVGLGLRAVVLVDGDVVEASNLNRQYGYTPADIGRPKALAAQALVLRQVPDAAVRAVVRYVHTRADLALLDDHALALLINCADQPATIETVVGDYAAARGLATITGGVGLQRGYWGPLAPHGAAWAPARAAAVPVGTRLVPKIRCASSHGPYNSIIAALIAHDAFAYLTGCMPARSLGRRMTFDFTTMHAGAVDPAAEVNHVDA